MASDKKSLRVLVVDDDTLMREILKAILRDEGFGLFGEAKDGVSALAQLERGKPDLVCLDVNMPGMSGLDVLKAMQARVPGMPVLMVTGDASMNTVREAVSLGAVGYLIKPFNAKRVADSLNAALKTGSFG
jgi:two-component system chemotaxis response regulator CheY